MSKVFLIGGSGHVGGAVLDQVVKAYPDSLVKVLVRSDVQAQRVTAKYPKVKCIVGNMSNLDMLEEASHEADLVVNLGPDINHEKGIKAILKGLKRRKEGRRKGYYIHTSGTYLIVDYAEPGGVKDARVWDDLTDIQEIMAIPDPAIHVLEDQIVRDAWPDVNIANISPGYITGVSPSVWRPWPLTTVNLVRAARALKSGYTINGGANQLGFIHVLDLAAMYMVLIRDALSPSSPPIPVWGPEAYYCGASENLPFAEFMREGLLPALQKHGVVPSDAGVVDVTRAELARAALEGESYDPEGPPLPVNAQIDPVVAVLGYNMRVEPSRMRKLGWKPEHGVLRSFDDAIPLFLQAEKDEGRKRN